MTCPPVPLVYFYSAPRSKDGSRELPATVWKLLAATVLVFLLPDCCEFVRWPVLDEIDACLEMGFDLAMITVFAGSLGRDLTPVLFAWP